MHESFLSPKSFSAKVKIFFSDFSVFMEPENGKTERVNENENKENKSVDEFKKYVLPQKPANTKVKTQSDTKAWKRFVNNNTKIGNCVIYLKTN